MSAAKRHKRASDTRPSWRPPHPFVRDELVRHEAERREFAEVERRGGRVTSVDLAAIVATVRGDVDGLGDDALAVAELRARLEAFEAQRRRYDAETRRPENLGPMGRTARAAAREEHERARLEAEGVWRAIPGTDAAERESTIGTRDELAILAAGNLTQIAAAEAARDLRLQPVEAGAYRLIAYSLPYYAPPIPTVQQAWIEWAMMHATAAQIGRALDPENADDPDLHIEVRKRAENEIARAVARMFTRGEALPPDAKFLLIGRFAAHELRGACT